MSLLDKIKHDINCVSRENESGSPDFILAEYLTDCLVAFEKATNARDKWHGLQQLDTWKCKKNEQPPT